MVFHQPGNLDEVLKLIHNLAPSCRVIAGGTDLLVSIRQKDNEWPEHLINLADLKEIKQIHETEEEIIIGAAMSHDEIVNHPLIKNHIPLLAEASRQIGSQQVRNRGTIGGNICNASPCADAVTALIALNADLEVCSVNEILRVSLKDFYLKPYQTILKPNEILTMIRIKKLQKGTGYSFIKLGRRNAVAISRINVAAVISKSKTGVIKTAALAAGSVFPVWKRIWLAERELIGKTVAESLFMEAGKITAREMIEKTGRRWSTPYKEPVVATLVKRALLQASGLLLE
ncbi:MAG: FAD binding domain-containing protein [Calditrichaceae bacterium]|nr:FAD binding domain-containing protein [Calditrichaceae bacterium]MBN2708497.1 FAD binding domain-containing protein [Calditrichaceae bacterium]RQV91967.1 MAG: xanthine dehydrogenase family protein subunit M [Calditrichota bacterium]